MGPVSKTRVFIVDDHAIFRDGVRALLEAAPMFEVVGEAGDANDGLAGIGRTEPDVAVVDVRIPGGDGVEMIREARSRGVRTKFVVLTSFRVTDAYYHAVMAGADAFIIKDAAREQLVETVTRVVAGEQLLDPAVVETSAEVGSDAESLLMVDLTERERTILELIAAGMTNKEIAEELFLAEKTVRNYVSSVLAKLGMRNRTEVAAYVVRLVTRHQATRRLAS